MCYNISYIEKKLSKLAEHYKVVPPPNWSLQFAPPVYHATAFAHPVWPVITSGNPDQLQFFKWGLIPFFIKDRDSAMKIWNQTANCIGEEAFEKPSFRESIKKRRCLIPVTGFFEWRHEGKNKFPHYIYSAEQQIMSIAGLYDRWVDKATGEIFDTFSVITCKANKLLSYIHNSKERMPLILPREREADWLDLSLSKEDVQAMVQPLSDVHLKAHTVSKLITSRLQDPNCEQVIQHHEYQEITGI